MSCFQTWPRRRSSGRSSRRSRSAPLPEHPRAKAQPGRGGALACPAQHGSPRAPSASRAWGAESRLPARNRGVATPPGRQRAPRGLSSFLSQQPPRPGLPVLPPSRPSTPVRTELGAAASRSPCASRTRG